MFLHAIDLFLVFVFFANFVLDCFLVLLHDFFLPFVLFGFEFHQLIELMNFVLVGVELIC